MNVFSRTDKLTVGDLPSRFGSPRSSNSEAYSPTIPIILGITVALLLSLSDEHVNNCWQQLKKNLYKKKQSETTALRESGNTVTSATLEDPVSESSHGPRSTLGCDPGIEYNQELPEPSTVETIEEPFEKIENLMYGTEQSLGPKESLYSSYDYLKKRFFSILPW